MFAFSIATINLSGSTHRWLARRHLLVGQLLDASPDLIALQNINRAIGQGRWIVHQVNARMADDGRIPYRLVQARHGSVRRFFEGVGIITRLPVIYFDYLALGKQGGLALRVNLELPAGAAGSRRQSLDFVSVHLQHGVKRGEARLEQAMTLTGWINEDRRVPLQLIAGDFNEPPDHSAIKHMRQSYRSAYTTAMGTEPLATYPTNLVQPQPVDAVCLDYVFISSAVYKVTAASILFDRSSTEDDTLYPSDHVGLMVSLEV